MSSRLPLSVTAREVTGLILGLSVPQWAQLLGVSLAAAIALSPWYIDTTIWAGVGLVVTLMVLGHLCLVAGRYLALPGLAALAACAQWVVAPWLSEVLPPSSPMFTLSVPLDDYLGYAIPATVMLWFGLHWPVRSALGHSVPEPASRPLSSKRQTILDGTIVAGLVLASVSHMVPWSLFFLAHILASFRFFAAACWMLTRTPGWKLRVGIVFVDLAANAAEQVLFYNLVHWGGSFLLLFWLGRRRPWTLATVLIALLGVLLLFQQVKVEYRQTPENMEQTGKVQSLVRFGSFVLERAIHWEDVGSASLPGDWLVRFNQGWIISRVMATVPSRVPYAVGKTLADAATFSVVPRALVPEKRWGSSREMFEHFTGLSLPEGTSMGLSIIGELYANFGRWGGVMATLIYGYVVGLLFAGLAKLARGNRLWWAVGPLVLVTVVEMGWNIEDTSNYIVKSAIVVFGVVWGIRPLRKLLAKPVETEAHVSRGLPRVAYGNRPRLSL